MNKQEREEFLTEIAEKTQEINDTFGEHGLLPPSIDCEDEECEDLPTDPEIMLIYKLFRELNIVLADRMS